jgi:uncharacterized OsmC-like protein
MNHRHIPALVVPVLLRVQAICCSAHLQRARRSLASWSGLHWGLRSRASAQRSLTGDLDLAGTLGINKEVPIGFRSITLSFTIDAPDATEEQIKLLKEKTEQYCVVMQTLKQPPEVLTTWTI